MNYVLFVCGRVGCEAINTLIELECNLTHVFIEREHDHELCKYYRTIAEICHKYNISFSIDSSEEEIKTTLKKIEKGNMPIDYIVSFGYRRLINRSIREMARKGALGTHFAPLPRYRGFAPLNWVLINGEKETAVNLFYLEDEVDSGDIIDRDKILIEYHDNINTLINKCIHSLQKVLKRAIPKLEAGVFEVIKQDERRATYTCARNPDDGIIDWKASSRKIYNLIRALTYPFPGAYTYFEGKKLTIWSCEEHKIQKYEGRIPGKIIKVEKGKGVVVLCGDGALLIKNVQIEDEKQMRADKILKSIRKTLGK